MEIDLKVKIELHGKWLRGEEGGERLVLIGEDLRGSDLRDSDLRGSNLSGSNLSYSNLRDSNLDFACWPFRCGSFHAKADKRLVAQLAKHLAMLDVSDCDDEVKEAMSTFRKMDMASWFDGFRDDLAKTPETDGES